MSARNPTGGFFVAGKGTDVSAEELVHRLGEAQATVLDLTPDGPVLAAWKEFPGQGLWGRDDGAVAYDLDLTNRDELLRLVGASTHEPMDLGQLLWSLYEALGEGFIDRLRGAFGFALWDRREGRLLVATDFYGIRPVVYALLEGAIVAASRIRHLLLHPTVAPEIDLEAVYQYLFFMAIPSPVTIYRSIRKLDPGHLMDHNSRMTTAVRPYYDIAYRPDEAAGESYWRSAIPLYVRQAVARHVPLSDPSSTGCFLSGGTDSSSVAGFYTQLAGRPARTFSIGFDEQGYNELGYAHIASRHFGTEQHDYFVTPEDVLGLIESLSELYDEPFGNSSVVPTYYCARLAREAGVEVLLAGDGGDEIFGGNERYVTNLVFQRYGQLPRILRSGVLEPLLNRLPSLGLVHKAKRYVRRANLPNPERFFSYNLLYEMALTEVFQREFLEDVDPECFLDIARAHHRRAAPAHDTDRLLYLDMKFTITDNDLRKVTQMTEAAGIRVRYPLLERELVDFSATIPPSLKVKPGKNRYIFKRALDGFLPAEIIAKSKHGFGLPIAPWFKKHAGLSQLLNDTLFTANARLKEWLTPGFLSTMQSSFRTDETSYYGSNLWVFLMLELWMRGRAKDRKS